jgi:hypothetical protein
VRSFTPIMPGTWGSVCVTTVRADGRVRFAAGAREVPQPLRGGVDARRASLHDEHVGGSQRIDRVLPVQRRDLHHPEHLMAEHGDQRRRHSDVERTAGYGTVPSRERHRPVDLTLGELLGRGLRMTGDQRVTPCRYMRRELRQRMENRQLARVCGISAQRLQEGRRHTAPGLPATAARHSPHSRRHGMPWAIAVDSRTRRSLARGPIVSRRVSTHRRRVSCSRASGPGR